MTLTNKTICKICMVLFLTVGINTSCVCTAVEWENQPIKSGKTTKIEVVMNSDQSGYFNKSIDEHCNVAIGLVKLVVKGEAE